jgi:heme/copper-type cytochrome/quinol oxidase subunit 3
MNTMQQETAIAPVAIPAAPVVAAEHAHADHHAATRNLANNKLAIWLFLASEVMFFSVLVAAYVWARFTFPDEHALLNVPLTSVNTFLLLISSYTVVRAMAGIQRGHQTKMLRSLALTIILGALFMGIMYYEYSHLSHEGVTLNSGPFGMAFYALTGFHGAHVFIGLLYAVYVFNRGFNGAYTREDHWGLELWGLYWHFVDVVWIFIFTIVYLL